jgi:hypothetical protein
VICFPSNDFHGEETNGRDVGVSWLLQVFSCLSEAQACVCLVQIPATVSQDFNADDRGHHCCKCLFAAQRLQIASHPSCMFAASSAGIRTSAL